MRTDAQRIADFWERVNKSGGDEACWPWTGSGKRYGYVYWPAGGSARMLQAHRVALGLTDGSNLQRSDYVRHLCHHTKCCNPAHLTWGSQKENKADQAAAGRQPRGEQQSCAKLTDALVVEIRRAAACGESFGDIARRVGVRPETVGKAVRRATWRHVP